MYRAKKVYETLGFQRGQSSKAVLNIGLRAKISSWLDEMEVRNYTINDDFTIDIKGSVFFSGKLDGKFPSFIKFRKLNGFFYCDNNQMISLEGAPQSVGDFFCAHNNLISLEGSPLHVEGYFSCAHNNLTSLEGAPKYVEGDFYCNNNKVQFTEEDVRKVSDVKGGIYIQDS